LQETWFDIIDKLSIFLSKESPLVDLETPVLRPVVWVGNSKKKLLGFPFEAQKLIGDELQYIQFGGMPKELAKNER
jgi:hypothetical protein